MEAGQSANSAAGAFVAFLFTDIEGSTRRWEDNPDAMRLALERHDRTIRGAVEQIGGHVFKTMGDAFCVAFDDPAAAVAAALAAQHALAAEDFSAVGGLAVRMAIHAGTVDTRSGDFYGKPLNRVARLLSVGHGGQVLLSDAVVALTKGILPAEAALLDLGLHRLKDLAEPEHIRQLLAPGLASAFPPLRSLDVHHTNLPQQATSFVGRATELAEIRSQLEKNRLVTLLGPGGVGKTRVSLQIGGDLSGIFPDGVWLLELATLTDPALVAESLCGLLGVSAASGRSATEIAAGFLRQKKLLLILDNCEHLIEAAARLADTLVKNCPEVRILASSRERLAIPEETIYQMPTLGVPARSQGITAAEALGYGAVQLFVSRAAAVRGEYELSDADAPAVAAICQRLDGIALAIELAVPRLKVLGPAQLLARLTDRFRLLVGGSRTALPRQQTLRALIDWSYDLLNETERTLLRRLSVFAGGWSTDGAARVAGGEPIEDWDVFDLMSALVDKSLVVADLARDEPRYRLLESTREYAAERRRHSGDPDRLRNLAEYMVEFYGTAELAWPTTPTESWLEAYGPEIENLRAAIDWAFGRDGDPVLGVALVARADRIVEELSLGAELRRWSETALQHLGPAIPEIEIVRIRDAVTTHIVGIGQASIVPTRRETVALARACGDPLLLGRTLARLAFSLTRPGEPNEEARALFDEAIRTLGSVGSNKLLATAQSGYAALHLVSGDAATARHLAEEALAICRRFGHRNGILGCNAVLAEADYAQGDVIEAIERAEEGLAAARDQNAMNRVCLLLTNLAAYRLALDQVAQGRAAAREALGLARALDHEAGAMFCLEHLALAAALDGAVEAAGLILGFTEHWYQTHQVNREPTEEKGHAKLLGLLAALPPSRLDALTRTGSGWTLETAAANAA